MHKVILLYLVVTKSKEVQKQTHREKTKLRGYVKGTQDLTETFQWLKMGRFEQQDKVVLGYNTKCKISMSPY